MPQVRLVRVAAEVELEDVHAGEAEFGAQGVHVRPDGAEVFGHDGRLAPECVARRVEDFSAGGLDPAAVFGRLVLGLGSEARMNTPASAEGNWAWRFTEGALTDELRDRLREMTAMYGRLAG